MDLSKLKPEEVQKLRAIAAQMHVSLEELLKGHNDVTSLLESYNAQQFGMLNEYDKTNSQVLND